MQEKLTAQQWGLQNQKGKKKSKYKNQITEYNGKKYHSKLEAGYAAKLDILKKAPKNEERVLCYRTQVPYKIFSKKGFLVFTYLLDFEVAYCDGRIEYVDTKGVLTPTSKMKIKAVEQEYSIQVKLVTK